MRKLLVVQVDNVHTFAFPTSALASLVESYVERHVGRVRYFPSWVKWLSPKKVMFRLKILVSLHALAFSSRALANRWLRVCGKATVWLSSPPPLEVSWRSPEWALLLVSALWHPLHVLSPILV